VSVNGFAGEIVLEEDIRNGKIVGIRCIRHNETPGFGAELLTDEALSVLIGQNVHEAQIDVVSGVTMTSKAINNALILFYVLN